MFERGRALAAIALALLAGACASQPQREIDVVTPFQPDPRILAVKNPVGAELIDLKPQGGPMLSVAALFPDYDLFADQCVDAAAKPIVCHSLALKPVKAAQANPVLGMVTSGGWKVSAHRLPGERCEIAGIANCRVHKMPVVPAMARDTWVAEGEVCGGHAVQAYLNADPVAQPGTLPASGTVYARHFNGGVIASDRSWQEALAQACPALEALDRATVE